VVIPFGMDFCDFICRHRFVPSSHAFFWSQDFFQGAFLIFVGLLVFFFTLGPGSVGGNGSGN